MATTYTYEQITAWVNQFAPRLYLCPDEKYLPCSVDWFLSGAQLFQLVPGQKAKLITSNPTQADLANAPDGSFLDIATGDANETRETQAGNLPSALCYCNVVRPDNGSSSSIEIQYYFCYTYNGSSILRVGKGSDSEEIDTSPLGNHQGDWEHTSVRLDANGNFKMAYFSQHHGGVWLRKATKQGATNGASFYNQNTNEQLLVYSARYGHGSYPWAGDFNTQAFQKDWGFSILNHKVDVVSLQSFDRTSSQGTVINTLDSGKLEIVRIDKSLLSDPNEAPVPPDWTEFSGHWGARESNQWSEETIREIVDAYIETHPKEGDVLDIAFGGKLGTWIAEQIAEGLTPREIVVDIIQQVQKTNKSFKPRNSPLTPSYKPAWTNGEVSPPPSAGTQQKIKDGSKYIQMYSGPTRIVVDSPVAGAGKIKHHMFYEKYKDSDDHRLRWTTTTEGDTSWSKWSSITKADVIYSAPSAVGFLHSERKGEEKTNESYQVVYVAFKGSDKKIYYLIYNGQSDKWSDSPFLMTDEEGNGLKADASQSLAIRGTQLFMTYVASGKMVLKVSDIQVDNDFKLDTCTNVTLPSTNVYGVPSIANTGEELVITYTTSQGGNIYLITSPDGGGDWSHDIELDQKAHSSPEIVITGNAVWIFFQKRGDENISFIQSFLGTTTGNPWSTWTKPHTFKFSSDYGAPFGVAAGAQTPIYLCFRGKSNRNLYTTELVPA